MTVYVYLDGGGLGGVYSTLALAMNAAALPFPSQWAAYGDLGLQSIYGGAPWIVFVDLDVPILASRPMAWEA